MNRAGLIAAFLARHGYGATRAEPLAQDASFRRYLRLTGGPRPAILMDAPPPEDIRPFVQIVGHLAGIGVSVPEIFAADEVEGLLLEEDLGDDVFAPPPPAAPPPNPLPQEAAGEITSLFDAAIDVLVTMQRAPAPPDLPVWDAAMMAETALATLFDWWWPAMFGAAGAGRRGTSRLRASRLLRRQPGLAAATRGHPTRRRARLPGCRSRPPCL
jgi:aminoglycoside/choline kinase family phosphotransferase